MNVSKAVLITGCSSGIGWAGTFSHHARILPSMGCVCIELNRYIDVFYSILVIIILGAYNERVKETPP